MSSYKHVLYHWFCCEHYFQNYSSMIYLRVILTYDYCCTIHFQLLRWLENLDSLVNFEDYEEYYSRMNMFVSFNLYETKRTSNNYLHYLHSNNIFQVKFNFTAYKNYHNRLFHILTVFTEVILWNAPNTSTANRYH